MSKITYYKGDISRVNTIPIEDGNILFSTDGDLKMFLDINGTTRKQLNSKGDSAYQIAIENGFIGTEEDWLSSLYGEKGDDGFNGWSPIFSIIEDGERRVLQLVDWEGGTGTKPSIGQYIGASGFVTNIALAIDIRGPKGTPPETITYLPNSIETKIGGYVSGDIESIKVFNDGNVYYVDEVLGVPGFEIDITFQNIEKFNKVVANVQYKFSTTHIVNIELYNYIDSEQSGIDVWNQIQTFQGLTTGYTQFTPGVIDYTPYVKDGNVRVRFYHVTTGVTAHNFQIDYFVLQYATEGPQGIRGQQGPAGAAGKTAYQSALEGGFVGTEQSFNIQLGSIGNINATLDAINRTVV